MAARRMASLDETPLLQSIAIACCREEGERSPVHLGDPAWDLNQHLNTLDEVPVWIWEDAAFLVVFSSFSYAAIVPSLRAALVDELIDLLDGTPLAANESDELTVGALVRRGYRPTAEHLLLQLAMPLDEPADGGVPEGFRVRGFEPGDLESRVDAHRSAFDPSRVVPESYAQVQALESYRPELDVVVEAPDGRIAAFCLAWLDEQNRAGEFEPVGTHADFRRLGLARAACTEALLRLRGLGAERCVVYTVPGSGAERLYRGLGFADVTRKVVFRTGMFDPS